MKRIINDELKNQYIELFGLNTELSKDTLDHLELISFSKGEFLYHQNNELIFMYFLVKGKLLVNYFEDNGTESVYSIETPLAVIGEVEVFSNDKILRNVKVSEDSILLALSKSYIQDHAYDNVKFLHFIMNRLRKRVISVSSLLSQSSESVENILSKYLLSRAEEEGDIIQLENRDSLSAMLGVSTRHLNRVLKQLHEKNIIRVKNKTLIIVSPSILRQLSGKGR